LVTGVRETMRERFMHALTVGGPGGSPPPIEKQSGAPHRYVGDMLAWVHGTIASESDVLSNLFSGEDGGGGGGEKDTPQQNTHFLRVSHLLPQAFDDMVRPLKVRVNQASRGLNGVVNCLKMCDLICLYHEMIGTLLPQDCSFMRGLDAIIARCHSRFDDLLKSESSKLLHSTTIYPSDLSVPPPVRAAVTTIASLCDVCARSVIGHTSPSEQSENDIKEGRLEVPKAIKTMVEAVQFVCQASASSLETMDRAVYIINTTEHLVATLDPYPLAQEWAASLHAEIDTWVDAIVGDLAKNVLRSCGLLEVLALAKSAGGSGGSGGRGARTNIAQTAGMDAGTLGPRLSSFAARLFDMEGLTELTFLSSPATKQRCHKAVLHVLAAAYAVLHDAVNREESGYGAAVAAELLPYTPTQIYTVCDISDTE
jgi:hypothetical protein